MTQVELKQVLVYHQKDSKYANLPNMAGFKDEIRRWNKAVDEKKLAKAKRDDLIDMLCEAIGHKPRQRSHAIKYHRFGLSFDYKGSFPTPKYRQGMSSDELKAMLELYPNPKMTVPAPRLR